MDDDDFDDLFAEVGMLRDSSQESLTHEAASLALTSSDAHKQLQARLGLETNVSCEPICTPELDESHDVLPTASSPTFNTNPKTARVTSLLPYASAHPPPGAASVLEKIDDVFEGIASDLVNRRKELSLTLKPRKLSASAQSASVDPRRICFPGKTAEEAWRFTVVTRILELIHEALQTGVVLSKRDLYYRDPALFGKQAVVDRYIDDIAFTFDVPRSHLNITAAAKGLMTGAATIMMRGGGTIDLSSDREGTLIPNLKELLSVDMTRIEWILVIEKEASFRSIVTSDFWNQLTAEGVMITGKGYPDIATRALLYVFSTPSPRNGFASPPVYALVDFDPDGLAILSVYKHGSLALAHENENLRVPHMRWLGLKFEDVQLASGDANVEQGIMMLTSRDRRKAVKMLERAESVEHDESFTRALQMMLMLNVKAEIQIVDQVPNGMVTLLTSVLCKREA